ncbi:sensor histidine kinase [Clostridium tarantellae]|uniref:histidine kinase n=1 Tax=Clostridium tarantellae TaxID=39493 RepID=A0A6I1MMZ0_9CLOT|nr:sensor histidine kinase [Clostridium tarantellae]MPQ44755.1 sensor histidine kinase [Clostridium tarantellae]
MCLMELIIKVIKVKGRDLLALIINTLVIILFYYLLFENSEILYPLCLSIFVILIYFIIEIFKYKEFLKKLEDSKRSPDYSNPYINFNEEEIFNTISSMHKEYLYKIHSLNGHISDRDALFSQWIHNMKTSLTVIDLACEKSILKNGEDNCIEDIKEENTTVKKNLEECLNVLRLDNFSRDYITITCNLKELITNVINIKKRDFIYKGVFPKIKIDENIQVYTDKKWCSYMIEQIISNSIKYSENKKGKKVEIEAISKENTIELSIKDEGVGIAKEDLPRIYDPFFTGNNGRKERTATGIGLYMVKLIGEKLGHTIKINSQLGKGTIVYIVFKKENFIL